MVTTAADLTVVPCEDGVTIIYVVDSYGEPEPYADEHPVHRTRELSVADLDVCYDRGRNLDHLRGDLPIVVRDTACAYLYIHMEDEAFRVYLRPTLRLNVDLYEILGTVDGELL